MNEDAIERKVERMIDHLDRLLLNGDMTQPDYDKAIEELDEWASNKRSGR